MMQMVNTGLEQQEMKRIQRTGSGSTGSQCQCPSGICQAAMRIVQGEIIDNTAKINVRNFRILMKCNNVQV